MDHSALVTIVGIVCITIVAIAWFYFISKF